MQPRRLQTPKNLVEQWDTVFTALSEEPRRQLVASLSDADRDASVSLPLAAMSPTIGPDAETLTIELYHQHLPLLARHGFVEWDEEKDRAWRGPNFTQVEIVMNLLQQNAVVLPDSLVYGCQRLERERRNA
ncbi:DUF7344 domain-containing protein [Natronocalculus amylovorans]|uniref:DUF7344 domain-containing protein n=1 Tax=Natronocalculus amylovorans TaxID=2917812 RepID=A0AAE3K7M4_9EURY|nr:hypothetical protein [Natronocalculus amylovorans]MCL9816387.1 hypothetical protein [Natronocalculus amylovorans]